LKYSEHVVEGLENAPDALPMLFDGRNDGKLMVKVADMHLPSDSSSQAAKAKL